MIKLDLADFSHTTAQPLRSSNRNAHEETDPDEIRLAGFDAGYRAGWDDAAKMGAEEQGTLSQGLTQSLEDMSFTATEAQAHVLRSLAPLLNELVTKVLPKIAHQTLAPLIIENLSQLASNQARQPIQILASHENNLALQKVVPESLTSLVEFVPDTLMGPSQVQLSCASKSLNVDLDEALSEISSTVQHFFSTPEGSNPNE